MLVIEGRLSETPLQISREAGVDGRAEGLPYFRSLHVGD